MSSPGLGSGGVFPPIEPPKVGTSKPRKWMVLALLLVCGIPSAALYWFHQHYRIFEIPSTAMEPTIRLGDHILVDMHYFRNRPPQRGEIAVIRRNKILIIKRVAALPGDTIEGRDGVTYLNGQAVSEPYVEHIGSDSDQDYDFLQNFGPTTLKAGECFVLGDNRDRSLDSRHPDFGPIPLTAIVGRPLYVLISKERDRAWKRIQ